MDASKVTHTQLQLPFVSNSKALVSAILFFWTLIRDKWVHISHGWAESSFFGVIIVTFKCSVELVAIQISTKVAVETKAFDSNFSVGLTAAATNGSTILCSVSGSNSNKKNAQKEGEGSHHCLLLGVTIDCTVVRVRVVQRGFVVGVGVIRCVLLQS